MLTIIKTHRFATLAFVMVLFGILAGVVVTWTSKAQKQGREVISPRVISRTGSIRVVSIERTSLGDNPVMAIKLQNTTHKDIKAYTIASGKSWVTKNYFFTEQSFAAGTTVDQIIPLSSAQDFKIPLNGPELSVTAVFFADTTSDGDSLYVSRLTDLHDGIRDQASRILPCLRGASPTTDCDAQALNLPLKQEGKSSDYEDGLEQARREILSQLSEVKEKTRTANLTEAVDKQEKVTKLFQGLAGPLQ